MRTLLGCITGDDIAMLDNNIGFIFMGIQNCFFCLLRRYKKIIIIYIMKELGYNKPTVHGLIRILVIG